MACLIHVMPSISKVIKSLRGILLKQVIVGR